MLRRILRAMGPCLLPTLLATAAPAADFMFRAEVDGRTVEGRPLRWSDSAVVLMGRDGQITEFHPKRARHAKKTAPSFRGYSVEEMRQRLYEEFGSRFELTSTGHYLVAHPRGRGEAWAERFESLYRTFLGYFRVRGFSPTAPPYPLVAIVFGNRSDYQRYRPDAPSTLRGHYEHASNRVYLYEQSSVGDDRWRETFQTVIHEATHQTAFNVGLHTRFADTPTWVVEGLAMMFEARGVHDARSYDRLAERVNRSRLASYRRLVAANRPVGNLATFVASDDAFDRAPLAAYAQAWALSFYLSETRPREYGAYLARLARQPPFAEYPATDRIADFRAAFGDDLEQLDAQFVSYVASLR